jgi:adenosylcobinamide-GDP ribazoletransferase
LHARTDAPASRSGVGAVVTAAVPGSGAARPWRPWNGLAGALAFLTIVPVPGAASAELSAAAAWFPIVGASVGALAGGVRALAGPDPGATVASVLATIVLVVVTGALHLDGLADTADGLGARGGRTRRLEVMRDPSTGVFGTFALIAWALLLVSTVASLDGDHALRALVVACALARWAALVHAATTSPARSDGLGAGLHVGRMALGVATAVSVAAALAICGLVPGAAALVAGALVAAASVAFARQTLGGRTGDTLGATVALTELAVCVVLLGVWQG